MPPVELCGALRFLVEQAARFSERASEYHSVYPGSHLCIQIFLENRVVNLVMSRERRGQRRIYALPGYFHSSYFLCNGKKIPAIRNEYSASMNALTLYFVIDKTSDPYVRFGNVPASIPMLSREIVHLCLKTVIL